VTASTPTVTLRLASQRVSYHDEKNPMEKERRIQQRCV
jgi:hypothetical protein